MNRKLKRKLATAISATIFFTIVSTNNSSAASNKDQGLALAASGCTMGMLDTAWGNLDFIKQAAVWTAIDVNWLDPSSDPKPQIHHAQLQEGLSSAAMIDSRWSNLSKAYQAMFSKVSQLTTQGKTRLAIEQTVLPIYGGTINASCKIAILEARAKAKKSGKSFPKWIIGMAGPLLPPLDLRF